MTPSGIYDLHSTHRATTRRDIRAHNGLVRCYVVDSPQSRPANNHSSRLWVLAIQDVRREEWEVIHGTETTSGRRIDDEERHSFVIGHQAVSIVIRPLHELLKVFHAEVKNGLTVFVVNLDDATIAPKNRIPVRRDPSCLNCGAVIE